MESIKVLIVEDHILIAESIANLLRKQGMNVIGVCASGEDAIILAKNSHPDLILLDIQLAGQIDGIAAAKAIQEKQESCFIYLSDYTDQKTVDRAKQTMPANFLSKPFQEHDLIRAIEIAFHNANAKTYEKEPLLQKHVFLKTDNQAFVKLSHEEIIFIRAERSYCDVVTDNRTYRMSNNMKSIHEQINHKDFVRVGRSYVVNVNRITSLNGNMIKMEGHEVQMSGEYRDDLLNRFTFLH